VGLLENGTGFAYNDRLKGEEGREGGRDAEGGVGWEALGYLFLYGFV